MRLSEYPYVIVRIGCSRCARRGHYRLARLADKYGSEITIPALLGHLAADAMMRVVMTGEREDWHGAPAEVAAPQRQLDLL